MLTLKAPRKQTTKQLSQNFKTVFSKIQFKLHFKTTFGSNCIMLKIQRIEGKLYTADPDEMAQVVMFYLMCDF